MEIRGVRAPHASLVQSGALCRAVRAGIQCGLLQTRALDAEKSQLDLETAVKQSNSTVENLREVVLSQEAKIASLQNEVR